MKGWKRALLMPWAAGGGIVYLLNDQFTTNATAPLTSPRTCEPGPGSLTIADTSNNLSIASQKLTIAGGTSNWAQTGFSAVTGLARVAGRALICDITLASGLNSELIIWRNASGMGTSSTNKIEHSVYSAVTADITVTNSGGNTLCKGGGFSANVPATWAIVLRSAGAFFIKDSTLQWVDNAAATATLYPGIGNFDCVGSVDNFRVLDYGAPWNTDYGIATNRTASPSTGATSTMTADGLVEFTWTCATGETLDLVVRSTDSNNRWIVRCDQAGSTIKLFEKNGGTETQRSTAAQTFTNATAYRIMVICVGNVITTFVANAQKTTYASASFNNTATGVEVNGFATGANLVCWPRVLTLPPG